MLSRGVWVADMPPPKHPREPSRFEDFLDKFTILPPSPRPRRKALYRKRYRAPSPKRGRALGDSKRTRLSSPSRGAVLGESKKPEPPAKPAGYLEPKKTAAFADMSGEVALAATEAKSEAKAEERKDPKTESKDKPSGDANKPEASKDNIEKPKISKDFTAELETKVEGMINESKKWPDIAEANGLTQKDISKLVNYFKLKGITRKNSGDAQGQDNDLTVTFNLPADFDAEADNKGNKNEGKTDTQAAKVMSNIKDGKMVDFSDSSDSELLFMPSRRSKAQHEFEITRQKGLLEQLIKHDDAVRMHRLHGQLSDLAGYRLSLEQVKHGMEKHEKKISKK